MRLKLLLIFTTSLLLMLTTVKRHEGNIVIPEEVTIEETVVATEAVAEETNGYTIVAEVTAYTASEEECEKNDGITASGARAVEGVTVAADDLSFGTKVIIDGHEYIVQDRFGGNYRNRIDIYMEDISRALEFGRRTMEIRIMEKEE